MESAKKKKVTGELMRTRKALVKAMPPLGPLPPPMSPLNRNGVPPNYPSTSGPPTPSTSSGGPPLHPLARIMAAPAKIFSLNPNIANVRVPPGFKETRRISLLKRLAGAPSPQVPLPKKPLVDYPLTDESDSEAEEAEVNRPPSPPPPEPSPSHQVAVEVQPPASAVVSPPSPSSITSDDDDDGEPYQIETAFKCRIQTWRLRPHSRRVKDVGYFLMMSKSRLESLIRQALMEFRTLKAHLRLRCIFVRDAGEEGEEERPFLFKCKSFLISQGTLLDEELEGGFQSILKEIDEFTNKGSGWVISSISFLELCINKCDVLRASSYIDLPQFVKKKGACINVQNPDDERCFEWAILSCLHHHKVKYQPDQLCHYKPYAGTLKFDNLTFPMPLMDIHKFEKLNNIAINVIGYDDDDEGKKKIFYPLYMNTKAIYPVSVDLLYIKNEKTSHYIWIKNMSRLLRSQITKDESKKFFCRNCLGHYGRQDLLDKHQVYCLSNQCAAIVLPDDKHNILKFDSYLKQYKIPFVIYADFESLLEKSTDPKVLHKHIPTSYAYYIKNAYDDKEKFPEKLVQYRGEDAQDHFVRSIYKDVQDIYHKYLENIVPMVMTDQDDLAFEKAEHCFLCQVKFEKNNTNNKVRDHDHVSGQYRGALCQNCNLNYQLPNFIPCLFHNFSRYDCHLFIKSLNLPECPGNISAIPHTEEDYISLDKEVEVGETKVYLRFLDSFRFLPSSLANLARTLKSDQFESTELNFPKDKRSLVLRKGVFPYEYIDHFDRYLERQLPPQHQFHSELTDSGISDEDYAHALNVWEAFSIQSLGEYSDLYLKCDVLILTDIFEQFRLNCLANYQLDPAHFFTSPGLSWCSMLKLSKVELQLLQDYEMIMFIERGIRGGISQVSHRHAKANNQYMEKKEYDPKKDKSYLMYFDVNNLYGWSMSQPLPQKDIAWLNEKEIASLNIEAIAYDAATGYILEVDLDYPDHLHDLHNEIPLAPFSELIDENWLSPYLGEEYKPSNVKKLLTTLSPKRKYVVHYRTLQLYLKLGLVLVKIHRGLKFSQSAWLKSYIDKNTDLRQKATDDFGRDLYKLMNNSVFGKFMENVQNHENIVLCGSWEKLNKQVSKASFKRSTIFTEDLAAVHLFKERIVFNKPIYVGMAILDISKFNIYDFHYNVMVPKYKFNLVTLYHDTDSFQYLVKNQDIYQDMTDSNFCKFFDTSNYTTDNIYGITPGLNRLVLGKMKDENKGQIMTEFIGLRSKMYANRVIKRNDTKKIKGIPKCIIKNRITFEDYLECLDTMNPKYRNVVTIRSQRHNLVTLKMNKKALCPLDDKKYILEDGVHCLSYGHYKLRGLSRSDYPK